MPYTRYTVVTKTERKPYYRKCDAIHVANLLGGYVVNQNRRIIYQSGG